MLRNRDNKKTFIKPKSTNLKEVFKDSGGWCTSEVISVHSLEQQETKEEDKTNAGNYHSTQQEAVASCLVNDLWRR